MNLSQSYAQGKSLIRHIVKVSPMSFLVFFQGVWILSDGLDSGFMLIVGTLFMFANMYWGYKEHRKAWVRQNRK